MLSITDYGIRLLVAIEAIAEALKKANELKKTELRLLAMRARPNCRREEGEFLERLTQEGGAV